jgi:CxxC-x17-CxxC domain-containing protein
MATGGEDQQLTCQDCQAAFTFSAAEQTFYRERGFRPPVRCASCRAARRAERNADLVSDYGARGAVTIERGYGTYGGVETGGTSGGGFARGFGSSPAGGPRQLFPAICDACGKDTQVPFAPRGDRPVYCRDCFNQRRGR